jgi:NAD(P)H-flavin reductase
MVWQYVLAVAVAIAVATYFLKQKRRGVSLQTVKLVEKAQVTHDTFLFTFLLEDQTQPLGLKVGEHIEVR